MKCALVKKNKRLPFLLNIRDNICPVLKKPITKAQKKVCFAMNQVGGKQKNNLGFEIWYEAFELHWRHLCECKSKKLRFIYPHTLSKFADLVCIMDRHASKEIPQRDCLQRNISCSNKLPAFKKKLWMLIPLAPWSTQVSQKEWTWKELTGGGLILNITQLRVIKYLSLQPRFVHNFLPAMDIFSLELLLFAVFSIC
ncbi:uncharacterized protein LOC111276083 isoform X2 [Durio zibethinus]|uniref:Uncharacterized protein LOC111276083 isoform X2 n=1 Tax=Durio zibethinus TaxID=66656 RepID=A0A6P5WP04_DURZI|nr:uncharacterized protein LOC111276083 isoform X2 [Durio zibethinus]